jgi:hypothetical protein
MNVCMKTAIVAMLLTLPCQVVHAQGVLGESAMKRLQGEWYNKDGRTIKFTIRNDMPKFTDAYDRDGPYIGSYRAGEGGADYVLVYSFGLRCYYNVQFAADTSDIVFTLRHAEPERNISTCIRGELHRKADSD